MHFILHLLCYYYKDHKVQVSMAALETSLHNEKMLPLCYHQGHNDACEERILPEYSNLTDVVCLH